MATHSSILAWRIRWETDMQEADMPNSLSILKWDLILNSKASSLGTHFPLGISHVYMNQMLQTSVFLFINLSFLKATQLKNQKGRWKNIFFFLTLNFCISFSTSTVQFPKASSNINKCRLYLTSSPSHYQDKTHCSSHGRPIKWESNCWEQGNHTVVFWVWDWGIGLVNEFINMNFSILPIGDLIGYFDISKFLAMYEHLQVNPHCWQRRYFIVFRAETYSSI